MGNKPEDIVRDELKPGHGEADYLFYVDGKMNTRRKNCIFSLDFKDYLSIIMPSISTIYKFSYHKNINHHMMDMLFKKLGLFLQRCK